MKTEIKKDELRAWEDAEGNLIPYEKKSYKKTPTSVSHTNNPIYNIWHNIKRTCYDRRNQRFWNNGAWGIRMHEPWHDYNIFLRWCVDNGFTPEKKLVRRYPFGNYNPDNCFFIDKSSQNYERIKRPKFSGRLSEETIKLCNKFDKQRGKVDPSYLKYKKMNKVDMKNLSFTFPTKLVKEFKLICKKNRNIWHHAKNQVEQILIDSVQGKCFEFDKKKALKFNPLEYISQQYGKDLLKAWKDRLSEANIARIKLCSTPMETDNLFTKLINMYSIMTIEKNVNVQQESKICDC